MAGYAKGTRKSKRGTRLSDINIGGFRIRPELAITALLSALYVLFLLGGRLESGSDAVLLSALSILIFGAFAYLVRSGSLPGLRPFAGLIQAFLALSTLEFIWDLASFFNLVNLSNLTTMTPALLSVANFILSIILIGGILYYEKGKLTDGKLEGIYIRAGNTNRIIEGVVVFIACTIAGIVVLFATSGGSALSMDRFLPIMLSALVFGILGGAYEELWFRGLLLSRLEPLAGENRANIIQAVIFGFFEAMAIYTIVPQPLYLPLTFIVGAALGYYLGKITIDNNSLFGAMLVHMGFYMLICIPIIAGMG